MPETLFNKVAGLRPATLLKKRLAQVFPYEFLEIFRRTETPPGDCFCVYKTVPCILLRV